MDVEDEREILRKLRRQRGDDDADEFLEEQFEEPERSDILTEKQVKEQRRKKA
jgi:hypothetical protein